MHRDVTLVAQRSLNKLQYLKLKESEKLQKKLYRFKRSFQLGDKKFRVIYTLILKKTSHIYITKADTLNWWARTGLDLISQVQRSQVQVL